MKLGILAARTQIAIEEIARKTDIELSTVKRFRDSRQTNLFMLEKLASELPEPGDPGEDGTPYDVNIDAILETIRDTKGVGNALYQRIEERLTG